MPRSRFGPNGIRQGSRRLDINRINVPLKVRVSDYIDVVDCGDVRQSIYFSFSSILYGYSNIFIAMVYVDNKVALRQLEYANKAILSKESAHGYEGTSLAKDGKYHPRVLTLVRRSTQPLRRFMRVLISLLGWRPHNYITVTSWCGGNIRSCQVYSFRLIMDMVLSSVAVLCILIVIWVGPRHSGAAKSYFGHGQTLGSRNGRSVKFRSMIVVID